MKRICRIAALAVVVSAPAWAGTARAAPKNSPWGEKYFPNVPVVTQDGKTARFYDDLIRDRLVVVSFIYTHCKQQCGLITANLARVQRELGDRMGKDIFFYSVTLDPERDTPEVLKRYGEAFHAGPGWTFLTGKKEDIQLLRKKFGELGDIADHGATINIGNDKIGQWRHAGVIDNPKYLALLIGGYMGENVTSAAGQKSYASVPALAKQRPGEVIFNRACAMCHLENGQSVGPDLRGVAARRDRDWLARWLKAPDKMLADKDPVALDLLAKSHGVAMPATGLSDDEVKEVVAYLSTLSPDTKAPAGKLAKR